MFAGYLRSPYAETARAVDAGDLRTGEKATAETRAWSLKGGRVERTQPAMTQDRSGMLWKGHFTGRDSDACRNPELHGG